MLYTILERQNNQVSIVANSNNNITNQCVLIKSPALNNSSSSSFPHVNEDNIINIQLLYNPNRPTESKLWDSNFYPMLLYRSLEYLTSDTKNTKKSMVYIATYIKNKKLKYLSPTILRTLKILGK